MTGNPEYIIPDVAANGCVAPDEEQFVAESPAMRKLRDEAALLAQIDAPVLIFGETASGKESVARFIHRHSFRSPFKFLRVNCAGLPNTVLQEELFGNEPGPASSAHPWPGRLELCQHGTLFITDIADLPPDMQGKLLHVLNSKQFFRCGGITPVNADVRIIAATSSNLQHDIESKTFRPDLYYYLSAFVVHVPPVRQRLEDIPMLMLRFMDQLSTMYGLPAREFSENTVHAFQRYSWPGNLRELVNVVRRYLLIGDERGLAAELDEKQPGPVADLHCLNAVRTVEPDATNLKSLVRSLRGKVEKSIIAVALDQAGWNRKAAARLLRISYRNLLYKIEEHGLKPADPQQSRDKHPQDKRGYGNTDH